MIYSESMMIIIIITGETTASTYRECSCVSCAVRCGRRPLSLVAVQTQNVQVRCTLDALCRVCSGTAHTHTQHMQKCKTTTHNTLSTIIITHHLYPIPYTLYITIIHHHLLYIIIFDTSSSIHHQSSIIYKSS